MSKILIVDDDQGTLNLIETCVKNLCDEVFTALDAGIGWKLYNKENPDLVITDYAMPKYDGYIFACMIDGDHPQCPVILVTAHSNIDDKLKSQFTHIFSKPLAVKEFKQYVKEVLLSL